MQSKNVSKIHSVKLVARKNENVIEIVVQEVNQVLSHGVRRSTSRTRWRGLAP